MGQREIEDALARRMGMSPEAAEVLVKKNAEFNDWFGFCRKCHEKLTGTLSELTEHKCGSKA